LADRELLQNNAMQRTRDKIWRFCQSLAREPLIAIVLTGESIHESTFVVQPIFCVAVLGAVRPRVAGAFWDRSSG
jgi:hypothetical protein